MTFSSLVLRPADADNAQRVRERIDQLTKPVGSLGMIETLAEQLAAIAPIPRHGYARRGILIAAADHGIAEEGVSAFPAEVTTQMVGAFLAGFAAINAFARSAQAQVIVADFGVAGELPVHPQLLDLRIAKGTANFARGDAMTHEQMTASLDAGVTAVGRMMDQFDCEIVALGEMGIANTASAAALVASLTGTSVQHVVGRGTGIDDERFGRKCAVVEAAVSGVAHRAPEERIAALGGFEIVGLAGAMAALAARRVPVVLDGFIVAAAALVATTLAPESKVAFIASHRSCEPGHTVALDALGLRPLLDLELRLGEATGATLAFGLCDAAARMVGEMKTFAEAGVATKTD